jgi:hypothetical protein
MEAIEWNNLSQKNIEEFRKALLKDYRMSLVNESIRNRMVENIPTDKLLAEITAKKSPSCGNGPPKTA